jgi:ketosteroid isomerase-like protein
MRPPCWAAIGALLMLGAPAAAQSAAAQSAATAPERELLPLRREMMLAANAHDTDRFLASYLHDTTLVMVFNGVVVAGYDSVRALQLKWWNNGRSDVVYTSQGAPRFTVVSPGAVVVTETLRSQRTDSTGVIKRGDIAVMSIWQKRPEGWRIVAVHESVAGR